MEGERRIRGAVHRVGCWCCIKPRLHFRPSIRELRSFSYGSLRAVPFPGIVFSIILISYSIIIPANSTEINPSDVYSLSRWFIYFSFFFSLSFFSFFFLRKHFRSNEFEWNLRRRIWNALKGIIASAGSDERQLRRT